MSVAPLPSTTVRHGHFALESGLHARTWIELNGLFVDPVALAPRIEALATLLRPYDITAVCGPLVGGAFVAQSLATRLGLRFYFTEPAGVVANATIFNARYHLPGDLREPAREERFAVVDDIVSAGSSARATVDELVGHGAAVIVVGALLVLGPRAVAHFEACAIPLVAPTFEAFETWEPERCPLCVSGLALDE